MYYLMHELQPATGTAETPKFYYVCYCGAGEPAIVDGLCYTTKKEADAALCAYERLISTNHTTATNGTILIPGAFGFMRSLTVGWQWQTRDGLKDIGRYREVKAVTIH